MLAGGTACACFNVCMYWRENERSRIRAVLVDNLMDFLGIMRINRKWNALERELRGVNERRTGQCHLGWSEQKKRKENNRISKKRP